MLGPIFSAVGGALLDNIFAKDRQEDSQAFSAQQYATRYQTQTKDMIAAGLNPMLAANQGPGSSPSSSPASAGNNFTQAALQAENLKAQARLTNAQAAVVEKTGQMKAEADLANVESQTTLNQAQLDNVQATFHKITAETTQSAAQAKLIEQQTNKVIEEIKNIPMEGKRLEEAVFQTRRLGMLQARQWETEGQRYDFVKAQAAKILAETGLLKYDLAAVEKLDNMGREAKQLQPLIDIFKIILTRPSK